MNVHFQMASMQISLHSAAPKSAEILHSLRSIFAEKGFDGASMQDLARAAGMSAGNFYRYFPSKAAIIEALISHDMKLMAQDFESALLSGDPMAEIRSQIRSRIHQHQCTLDGCLWAEINAVALRKPEIAEIIAKMEATVTDYLVKVYATRTGTTSDPAQSVFAPQAALVIALFRAAVMIGSPSSNVKTQVTDQIIGIIEKTLDDLSSGTRKDCHAPDPSF